MIINSLKAFQTALLPLILIFASGCQNDDPVPENIPELITKVTLTFSPSGGGAAVTVTATDPDGEGVQDIQVDGPINLVKDKTYILSISLINGLYKPGEDGYDITSEVKEEGDEHQFFFGFSEGVFSSPSGTGNIKTNAASPAGAVNYTDEDAKGLPIGIETSWTTSPNVSNGKVFRIVLKHQPSVKSATSSSLDGETDLDISFDLNITE